MTPRFNLVNDPWITVRRLDGPPETVSLTDCIANAANYTGLTGDLPTQALPILRLLLAIVHAATDGPADGDEWRRMWETKRLPADDVTRYLAAHADRFELFHPETPFYQVADLTTKKTGTGLNAFIADVPTGNPKYATRAAEGLERIGFAEAARWLVHCQAFDLSGIKGAADGDPRAKGGKSYPIGPGSLGRLGGVYAEGDNLAETVLLNFMPLDFLETAGTPIDGDLPAWEREPHGPAPEHREPEGAPNGLLDLYTWQSRRLRLTTDGHSVTGAVICQGDRLELRDQWAAEPMTAWRRSENQEKLLKLERVYLPRRHDPDRAFWRGIAANLPALSTGTAAGSRWTPPLIARWIGHAHAAGLLERDRKVHYHAVGLAYGTQEAVVTDLVDDRLTMAAAVFDATRPELATAVADAVKDADNAVRALAALARDLARAAGSRDSVDGAGTAAASAGYAALGARYRTWLALLDADEDTGAARTAWQAAVWAEVRDAAARLVRSAGEAAWKGRGTGADRINSAIAENRFRRKVFKDLPLAFATPIGATDR
ncbi:type I-E CRISPR-associated protein Cse1/CasA [Glycomyces sp. NPDC047010]|uniref:type I-E CRISPR-associated protein Cse1/CasA n=1 Tax=Glycomyces sp. NPDC047010 TaxID=3155023 RepID=UPI0033C86447